MKMTIKTALDHLYWDQNELIDEKMEQKILWDCPFKGTVSRDFLYPVFSPKQLLLVPLDMS
jgi:hypothetical protein